MADGLREDEPFEVDAGSPTATLSEPGEAAAQEPAGLNRSFTLGVIGTSHCLNHVQSGLGAVLFPVMMNEMGFSFFQLGLLSSFYQFSAQGMQAAYGLLAQYYRRSILLGIGNVIVGLGGMALGLTSSFAQVVAVRVVAGAGASAQHPVASAILASYFRQAKAQVLAAHNSVGNVGSLIAPVLAVALLHYLNWRTIWIVLAIPSVIMGLAYFFFRDSIARTGSKKQGSKIALNSYLACLRNRQVMVVSAIQMVGAAGRGTGVNNTYFVPFFMLALGVDTTVAGLLLALLQFGGLAGPLGIGWVSDRTNPRNVLYAVMLFSTITTVTLVLHSQISAALLLNVLIYGAVVNARGTLTQAMTADAVPDEHIDAAFSIYYFFGFVSGPAWTALTGYLVDSRGFSTAFMVISVTYLLGMGMIALMSPRKRGGSALD